MDDFDTSIKVIVVGNGGIGKTSLLQRYCTGQFSTNYKKTIGTDFLEKQVYSADHDSTLTLMLWDTAGQEAFDALTAKYYRGAAACILAFSSVDRDSFDAVNRWRKKVDDVCGPGNCLMTLVQTKCDLLEEAIIEPTEAEDLARENAVRFFRISTKDNFNVEELFSYVAAECIRRGLTSGAADSINDHSASQSVSAKPASASPTTISPAAAPTPARDSTTTAPQVVTLKPTTQRAKSKSKFKMFKCKS